MSSALVTPGRSSPGMPRAVDGAEADAEENDVVGGFEFGETGGVDGGVEVELDAEPSDHVDFAQRFGERELVLGDPVGVEAAGQRALVVDGGGVAVAAQLGRACERCGAGADERDALAGGGRGRKGEFVSGVEVVHRVALQKGDFDGLAVVVVEHACTFAEHLDGACAGAGAAENVGVEDGLRRALQVAGGDLFDEARHVDVGGAGLHAGRIEAEEAAVSLGDGGLGGERGVQVGEERRGGGRGGDLMAED